MFRTYKYRLRPTQKQAYILNDLLFQMQTVYNDALNERRVYWQRSRKSVTYCDQWARMRNERHQHPDETGLLNASSIQQMLRRVDKAYQAFYTGKRGLPRFKGRNRFKSVEYRYGDGCKLDGEQLYIQHVGRIKVCLHRNIPNHAKIKHAVVKRNGSHWDVALMLELPNPEPAIHPGPAVGIDVGLKSLLALSDGTRIDNPRWLRNALRDLRVAQRRLSRRKKFGSGWQKAKRQVTKLQNHIANQRRDFWHKLTTELTRKYGFIAVEDMNLAFMTHNGTLSLSAHDAALGLFRQMLAYKVEKTGTLFVAVNPSNTSQLCSGCGVIVAKGLDVRTHRCPDCGLVLDRDVNAAFNILALGLSVEALTYPVADRVASEAPPLF
jgi:putative transposase